MNGGYSNSAYIIYGTNNDAGIEDHVYILIKS